MWIKEWSYKKKYDKLLTVFFFMVAGIVCNCLVLFSNSCVMPVYGDYNISTDTHKTLNNYEDINEVQWLMLADIYWFGDFIILSIGDILMFIGLYHGINLFIVHVLIPDVMNRWKKRKILNNSKSKK